MNKLKLKYYIILITYILITSCASTRQSTYLTDSHSPELMSNIPANAFPYTIKPKDILYINIATSNEEMNRKYNPALQEKNNYSNPYSEGVNRAINGYEVDSAGKVNLSYFGSINLANKTLMEAEILLKNIASEFINVNSVKVKILNFKITIIGEVKSPGIYYNYDRDISIFDALGLANGTSDYSRIDKILVMRQTKDGNKLYTVDLTKKNSLASEVYYLMPNDVVMVQQAGKKAMNQQLPLIAVIISSLSALLLLLNFLK